MGILVLVVVTILFIYQIVIDVINGIPFTIDLFRQNLGWLVSLAIAAIPFHFPLITTIILLTGVLQLARKQAIVRNLNAVETLGRISVVCSDKTGTLTKNQMTVKKIYFNGKNYDVSGDGYDPNGQIQYKSVPIKEKENPLLLEMLSSGVINNISDLIQENVKIRKGSLKVTKVIGMPTEGALLTLAVKAGLNLQQLRQRYTVIKQFNFTSDRKRMSTIVSIEGKSLILTKGAPEVILKLCTNSIMNSKIIPITQEQFKELSKQIELYAKDGLRVLAFAYKQLSSSDINTITAEKSENNLTFMGLVAMLDPPREGVKDSIRICNEAGIRVVMITGDFSITAKTIAKELGIWKEGDLIVEGNQIKNLSPEDITKVSVFARVAPEHKQIIIKDYQDKNQVVAMTGDGVNDALARRKCRCRSCDGDNWN